MALFTRRALNPPQPPAIFTDLWEATARALDG
jgi:hypothetical protein